MKINGYDLLKTILEQTTIDMHEISPGIFEPVMYATRRARERNKKIAIGTGVGLAALGTAAYLKHKHDLKKHHVIKKIKKSNVK